MLIGFMRTVMVGLFISADSLLRIVHLGGTCDLEAILTRISVLAMLLVNVGYHWRDADHIRWLCQILSTHIIAACSADTMIIYILVRASRQLKWPLTERLVIVAHVHG